MKPDSLGFSMHALEARFEMQYYYDEYIGAGDGGGGDYGYYGNSWGDLGSGGGYVGNYQVASDNSGAMLDDGSFTDGSTGAFPSYSNQSIPWPERTPTPSLCDICRC
ncbi:MAG TPA: hypothetical protein VKB02_10815 [Pyrinomonadaceae bacterium]|nr:hypothetical protein [Pyrinomonadaceae bacterium]